jgi:hypothetical protein
MAAGGGPEPSARDAAGGPAPVGSSHPVAARPAGEAVDTPPALPGGDAATVLPDGSDGLAVLTGSTPAAVGAAAAPGDEPPAPDRSDVAALPPALSARDGPAMVGPAPPATEARPAAASPQPPARPTVVGRYAIQVAAVRDLAGVYREWRHLAERHPDLGALGLRPPQRVEIRGGGTFYRVIVGAFATRADAQAACGRLREDGSCRTIVP